MRILFVARSLAVGGAERQLTLLASGLAHRGHSVIVHTHHSHAVPSHASALRGAGVEHRAGGSLSLLRTAQEFRPDVVYGFGPGPNVQSALLRPLLPGRLVWGLRNSDRSLAHFNWLGRIAYRLEGRLGALAALIITNSQAGLLAAQGRGMPTQKIVVIPNGIDTQYFAFSREGRDRIRSEWSVDESTTLIGVVGRLHPAKAHDILFQAVALLGDTGTRFVVVGTGPREEQDRLQELVGNLGLGPWISFVGERHDMPDVYSGLDLLCLPSTYEGFPNVLAEAMACGVPCVVSNVGDASSIVGSLGYLVPRSNPSALATGIAEAADRISRDHDGEWRRQCRQRIVARFSVERMVTTTEDALLSTLGTIDEP